MQLPLIDIPTAAVPAPATADAVDQALSNIGFMLVRDLGLDKDLLQSVYRASHGFFTGPQAVKRACAYLSAEENFGYQGLAEENLDPSAPADLKETFTMRNILNRPMPENRWPSAEFRDLMAAFYTDVFAAGKRLQRILANALDLPEEFFVQCHSGENVTLRLLYYPASGVEKVQPAQLGAGAHTDYGLITLLFQDDIGGLQVLDKQNQWLDVTPQPDAVVINSGDLLERWTNGRYKSTLHRVQPKIGDQPRLSIAMFIDPDSATMVEALPSCTDAQHPPLYPPITAGEHVQQKLAASHKDRF